MRAAAHVGDDVLDLVGIGFGPSNLGLAIALEEHNATGTDEPLRARFLERQARFGWHRGMLLDGATMQVSFMKDLVTMRNPSSDFSFLTYLHERGRLVDFINHKTLFPLRVEFHDYLEWAAARVEGLVTYDRTVTDVVPVVEAGTVVAFDVVATDTAGRVVERHRARNVAVAVGLAPRLPLGVALGERVWHNLDLLHRVEALAATGAEPRRFVVVGAGQSAAEAVDHLHTRFAGAEVCSVFARYGYAPSDDSPFANRIFDPEAVDLYYGADEDVKRLLLDYHRNTNYSVVDGDLIGDLYRRAYEEQVRGARRLHMLNASKVADVDVAADEVVVEVESLLTGERTTFEADAIVYATGYRPVDCLRLLGTTADLVERRVDGAPEVRRDYRLSLQVPATAGVYLQGGTEHSHGISSSLLSNVAVRTGEIVDSVAGHRSGRRVRPAPVGAAVAS